MSGGVPRSFDVSNRSTIQQYNAGEFECPDPALWWRVLWRQLRITLSGRLLQLRERLAQAPTASYDDPHLLWAAVALIVAPSPDSLLLIKRAEHPGDPWSGHMALPGGRRDPDDIDLLATALRETNEEVGISLSRATMVGALADVVPRTPTLPPIAVRPFLLAAPNRPVLMLNPEVAAATWVSLEELLRPDAHQRVSVNIQGISREVSAFLLEAGLVWGMTERVLSGLVEHFREVCSEES
jgi:8-oxo-dGTP pyrophosphatase MutT (NUDIX family)